MHSDDRARLETTLELVEEIGHDLNNALLVVKGYATVVRGNLEGGQYLADLAEIEGAADSAVRLTRRLLELGRRQTPEDAALDDILRRGHDISNETGQGQRPAVTHNRTPYETLPAGARKLSERAAITCVLADDHPAILDSVARYLTECGFSLVGAVADGAKALDAVVALQPVVCVADIRMPKMNGLELAREVIRLGANTGVLLYSGAADRALVSEALEAGARGFALKDAPLSDLSRAIEAVANGNLYIDPVLAAQLPANRSVSGSRPLTHRQREILRLIAEGRSYADIGAMLILSPDTIRSHAQHAMTKLGAHTRAQAVAIALRDGIFS